MIRAVPYHPYLSSRYLYARNLHVIYRAWECFASQVIEKCVRKWMADLSMGSIVWCIKLVVEVSNGIPRGIYFACFIIVYQFILTLRILFRYEASVADLLRNSTLHTHTRTHTESQKFWVHKRTATQLSWKHKWLIQVRALLNRLQGQCPHVDSQASTLWPKQLHPLIHLHETWRTQGVFFLRETLTSRVHSGIVLSPRND